MKKRNPADPKPQQDGAATSLRAEGIHDEDDDLNLADLPETENIPVPAGILAAAQAQNEKIAQENLHAAKAESPQETPANPPPPTPQPAPKAKAAPKAARPEERGVGRSDSTEFLVLHLLVAEKPRNTHIVYCSHAGYDTANEPRINIYGDYLVVRIRNSDQLKLGDKILARRIGDNLYYDRKDLLK